MTWDLSVILASLRQCNAFSVLELNRSIPSKGKSSIVASTALGKPDV